MVNLVKTVELLVENSNNEKLMKTLKKQLRTNGKDINKLKKSSLFCNTMLAPIHAALFTNSPRVFKLVFDSKDIEVDSICTFKGDKYNTFDLAVTVNKNNEICKLVSEKIKTEKKETEKIRTEKMIETVIKDYEKKEKKIEEKIRRLEIKSKVGKEKEKKLVEKMMKLAEIIKANENKLDENYDRLQECENNLENRGGRSYELHKFEDESKKTENNSEETDNRLESNNKIKNDDAKTPKHSRICWNCAEKGSDVALYKCAGCRKAYYCDDECQAEDWDVHGEYCMMVMERRKLKLLGS